MAKRIQGMLLDVDGTLVDSNDSHTHAWLDAMAEQGYHPDFEKVRPLIGMGGDKVLPETIGVEKNSETGKKLEQRRKQIFQEKYLPNLKPFPMARELLYRMHQDGLALVIATSSSQEELQKLLAVIGPDVQDWITQETTSQDASQSKPDPDIMNAAMQRAKLPANALLMLGDTPYDIESAGKASIKTIALQSGGWDDTDLAQAIAIYDNTADLLAHYEDSPICK
jgi:HAD superfamily hydrolase (TIGR01509 family)